MVHFGSWTGGEISQSHGVWRVEKDQTGRGPGRRPSHSDVFCLYPYIKTHEVRTGRPRATINSRLELAAIEGDTTELARPKRCRPSRPVTSEAIYLSGPTRRWARFRTTLTHSSTMATTTTTLSTLHPTTAPSSRLRPVVGQNTWIVIPRCEYAVIVRRQDASIKSRGCRRNQI